jgi:predicted ester cyclase
MKEVTPVGNSPAKEVMRRYFQDAWGNGDVSILEDLVSDRVTVHSQYEHVEVLPPPGAQACRDEVALYRAAFPDLAVAIRDQVAEGDLVMTRWEASGTHQGELLGVAPTGRRVRIASLFFARLAGGRIAETRNSVDILSLHQQLGLTGGELPYTESTRDGAWPAHPGSQPAGRPDDPARELVRQLFDAGYRSGDRERLAALLHPDYRSHENLAEPVSGGPALVLGRIARLREAAPGARAELNAVVCDGDRAAYCWTLHGAAPSGRPFSVMGSSTARISGGRIAETWHCYDALPFLHAVGATPPAEGTLQLIG